MNKTFTNSLYKPVKISTQAKNASTRISICDDDLQNFDTRTGKEYKLKSELSDIENKSKDSSIQKSVKF